VPGGAVAATGAPPAIGLPTIGRQRMGVFLIGDIHVSGFHWVGRWLCVELARDTLLPSFAAGLLAWSYPGHILTKIVLSIVDTLAVAVFLSNTNAELRGMDRLALMVPDEMHDI